MVQADRIQEYLQRLTPLARGNLLTELERLEVCGSELRQHLMCVIGAVTFRVSRRQHRIERGEHHLTLNKLETVLNKLKIRLKDIFPDEC